MTPLVFRVDGTPLMGAGHIIRCRTLAQGLQRRGYQTDFTLRSHQGHLSHLLNGSTVHLLPPPKTTITSPNHETWLGTSPQEDAGDFLKSISSLSTQPLCIVDHYAIDREWMEMVRPKVSGIVVIDDLANRPLDADLVIDPNPSRTATDYLAHLKHPCPMLLGPRYALLREEFKVSTPIKINNINPYSILISLGALDSNNLTLSLLKHLQCRLSQGDLIINVVLSSNAPHLSSVAQYCSSQESIKLHTDPKSISTLMQENDLCIGAAGTTSWERASVGLPSLLFQIAQNQAGIIQALEQEGCCINLGEFSPKGLERLDQIFDELLQDTHRRSLMQQNGRRVCDGHGVDRVINHLEEKLLGS
jgi:UDP-2,4-diacetamido-2,4,6-trideoxy-beta-L-altropyranose hydrolase